MNTKASLAERRNWVRAKRILTIQYRLTKSKRKTADTAWGLSVTNDMSLGGVSFYTEHDYRAGDILEVHVIMSGVLDILKGPAKIVRIAKKAKSSIALLAVKFLDIKPPRRDAKAYTKPISRRAKRIV